MATDPIVLFPDFRDFLKSLNARGVRYLLLGGYAVTYHGYKRMTGDMDVYVAIDPANLIALQAALVDFGFSSESVTPDRLASPGKVFRFGVKPMRIELLTMASGIEFEASYARRVVADLDGLPVSFISLEDLRANKLAAGRDKDLLDLRNLPS